MNISLTRMTVAGKRVKATRNSPHGTPPAFRSGSSTADLVRVRVGVRVRVRVRVRVTVTPPFQNCNRSIQAGVLRCLQTAPCGTVALGTSGLEGPGRLRP